MYVEASPVQAQASVRLDQAQACDVSVTASFKRIAERYLNDIGSSVNGIHLERGPSGQVRVVIELEIANISY
jgi:hypothetical protein